MDEREVLMSTGRSWHGGAVLVLAGAGLLIAAGIQLPDDPGVAVARGGDLTALVERQSTRVAALEQQANDLSTDVDRLGSQGADSPARTVIAQAERTAAQAGFTEIEGPGVTVTLSDAPVPEDLSDLPDGTTPDDFVVHQQDVEGVVNALWTGGAEGLMIMDRRITSTSAVRCVGNVIILDGQVYSPPFEITALGDPASLVGALDASEQVGVYRQWADFIGLGYGVTERDQVVLPPATSPTVLGFAQVPEQT
jgi:uncharacterized protein YlxW (UPF0749 family)